ASFVDYGNHRHGFLAFSEVHPDYYKIPVGDREPGDVDPAHGEAEAREAEPDPAGENGLSLAAALPEPVPVPPAPEVGEDESVEAAEPEAIDLSHSPSQQSEMDSGGEAPLAEMHPEARPVGDNLTAPPSETVSGEPVVAGQQAMPPGAATVTKIPIATASIAWDDTVTAPAARRDPEVAARDATMLEPAAATAGSFAATSADLDEAVVPPDEFSTESSEPDMLALPAESATAALIEREDEAVEPVETLGGDELEEAEHQRSRTIRHYKIQ